MYNYIKSFLVAVAGLFLLIVGTILLLAFPLQTLALAGFCIIWFVIHMIMEDFRDHP